VDKVVLSLSGGMDSTTLLAYYLSQGSSVHCINFFYKSKHNNQEQVAIEKICNYYKVPLTKIDVSFIGDLFKSNLLQSGEEIPEGHYEQENMSLTVVPGRNSIFTTIAAGFAESIGANVVALGQHKGDHCIPFDEIILTNKGKKLAEEINIGDKILSFNLSNLTTEFKEVTNKISNGFREDIYEIITQGGRIVRTTSNHKFYVVRRSNFHPHTGWEKEIKEVKCEDLKEGDFLITPVLKRSLIQKQEITTRIDLLNYCDKENKLLKFDDEKIWIHKDNKVNRWVDSQNFISLLGWYITEGFKGSGNKKGANSYRVMIAQSKKANPENYEEIKKIVKEWGFNITQDANNISFSGPTTKIFDMCGKLSISKQIPKEFMYLHPDLLFDTLIKGDGCILKSSKNNFVYNYSTKSSILKEQIVELAVFLGYSAGVNFSSSQCFLISMFKTFNKKSNFIGEGKLIKIKKIQKSQPKEVYDFTVQDNHNFFAGLGSGILVSNSIYADCRPEFVLAINKAIQLSSDKKVSIEAPFLGMDKAEIVSLGLELKVPYELTYTCYKGREKSCGVCGSCVERISSFMKNHIIDPIQYEIPINWEQDYKEFLEQNKK
jgi:7-cyano-7-deazaguanine synthase in queuosine biosynthesis